MVNGFLLWKAIAVGMIFCGGPVSAGLGAGLCLNETVDFPSTKLFGAGQVVEVVNEIRNSRKRIPETFSYSGFRLPKKWVTVPGLP